MSRDKPEVRPPRFRLENRTGYDTDDLESFCEKGLAATATLHGGGRGELRIVFSASPIRSRGCAEVGTEHCSRGRPGKNGACAHRNGGRMVIAIAAPWRFSLRRLARLFEHECAHIRGYEHEDMSKELLLSLGPTPAWAQSCRFRYYEPAPPQIPYLRRPDGPHGKSRS